MIIAAIMESTSEPMKIQISNTTERLLDSKVFCTELRGDVTVPRMGPMQTYWLTSKKLEPVQHVLQLGKAIVHIGKTEDNLVHLNEPDATLIAPPDVTSVLATEADAKSLGNITSIKSEVEISGNSTLLLYLISYA